MIQCLMILVMYCISMLLVCTCMLLLVPVCSFSHDRKSSTIQLLHQSGTTNQTSELVPRDTGNLNRKHRIL